MQINKLIRILNELNTRPDLDVCVDQLNLNTISVYKVGPGEDAQAKVIYLNDDYEN